MIDLQSDLCTIWGCYSLFFGVSFVSNSKS